jgi:hypothetical protein
MHSRKLRGALLLARHSQRSFIVPQLTVLPLTFQAMHDLAHLTRTQVEHLNNKLKHTATTTCRQARPISRAASVSLGAHGSRLQCTVWRNLDAVQHPRLWQTAALRRRHVRLAHLWTLTHPSPLRALVAAV